MVGPDSLVGEFDYDDGRLVSLTDAGGPRGLTSRAS
jgi:hypothetical protein